MHLTARALSPAILKPPVDRLPEDVLHSVFHWLSIVDVPGLSIPPVGATSAEYSIRLGWIIASHVCRKWRAIILRMPPLWAGIAGGVFASQEVCETMIERAQEAPLQFWDWQHLSQITDARSITAHKYAAIRSLVARLAPRYINRLENMALHIDDGNPGGGAILAEPLPQLKALYLSIGYRTVYHHLSKNFLPFRAPNLRFLAIEWTNDIVGRTSLLHALSCSPLLEELELEGVVGVRGDFETTQMVSTLHTNEAVQLPKLKFLRYAGGLVHAQAFSSLWKAIKVPSTVHVMTTIFPFPSELAIFTPLHEVLARPNNDTLRLSYSCTDITTGEDFAIHVYASTLNPYYDTVRRRRHRTGVQIYVTIMDMAQPSSYPDVFVSTLLTTLTSTNIRYLDFDMAFDYCQRDRDVYNPVSLQRALRPLTNVMTISVGRDSDLKFLKELLCPTEDTSAAPLFPQLQELVLKHPGDTMPKMLDRWSGNRDGAHLRMEGNCEAITHLCSELSERHCPLKRIRAVRFSSVELGGSEESMRAQESWIERVREMVEVVVVDP